MVKVGDRIEILEENLELARVKLGDVLTVSCVYDTWFTADENQGRRWEFSKTREGYKIISELQAKPTSSIKIENLIAVIDGKRYKCIPLEDGEQE